MKLGQGFGAPYFRAAHRLLDIPTTPFAPEVVADFTTNTYTMHGESVALEDLFETHPVSLEPFPTYTPGVGLVSTVTGAAINPALAMKAEAAAPFLESGYVVLVGCEIENVSAGGTVVSIFYNSFEDIVQSAYWQAGAMSMSFPGMNLNYGLVQDDAGLFDQVQAAAPGPAFRYVARIEPDGAIRLSLNGEMTNDTMAWNPEMARERIAFGGILDAAGNAADTATLTIKFIAIYPVDSYTDLELDQLSALA